MKVSRRDFLKTTAAVSAATALGMAVPDDLKAVAKKTEAGWKWEQTVGNGRARKPRQRGGSAPGSRRGAG